MNNLLKVKIVDFVVHAATEVATKVHQDSVIVLADKKLSTTLVAQQVKWTTDAIQEDKVKTADFAEEAELLTALSYHAEFQKNTIYE